jgi:hypothetical protein
METSFSFAFDLLELTTIFACSNIRTPVSGAPPAFLLMAKSNRLRFDLTSGAMLEASHSENKIACALASVLWLKFSDVLLKSHLDNKK